MRTMALRISDEDVDALSIIGTNWEPAQGPTALARQAVKDFIVKHRDKLRKKKGAKS